MSPGVMRWRTAREVARARAKFGEYHTATWAAFARAHVAWGGWRGVVGGAPTLPEPVIAVGRDGKPVDVTIEIPFAHVANPLRAKLAHAYTTADLRVRGAAGLDNRIARRAEARKVIASMRTIPYEDSWANDKGFRGVVK